MRPVDAEKAKARASTFGENVLCREVQGVAREHQEFVRTHVVTTAPAGHGGLKDCAVPGTRAVRVEVLLLEDVNR